jgi:hypothetical protein
MNIKDFEKRTPFEKKTSQETRFDKPREFRKKTSLWDRLAELQLVTTADKVKFLITFIIIGLCLILVTVVNFNHKDF